MAAFAAGIFSHVTSSAQTLTSPTTNSSAKPDASPSDGTSSSSTSSSTISANDFLTLLVTEMKNQDPTANNDPNQYINQLVNVNSLEQLIDINQNLKQVIGTPNAGVDGTARIPSASSPQAGVASAHSAATPATQSSTVMSAAALKLAPGNLTVPKASRAAQTLAHALDGSNSHVQSAIDRLR